MLYYFGALLRKRIHQEQLLQMLIQSKYTYPTTHTIIRSSVKVNTALSLTSAHYARHFQYLLQNLKNYDSGLRFTGECMHLKMRVLKIIHYKYLHAVTSI